MSMACNLNNKCAKNLSKRTVLLQLIIKNVVTCFFGTQCRLEVKTGAIPKLGCGFRFAFYSNYLDRLRDIGSYSSKIANFFYTKPVFSGPVK